MPRPAGTIGETKLKILAIIHYKELHEAPAYGYNIWMTLKERFHSYLLDDNLRNVYRHLGDLRKFGLVKRCKSQSVEGCPERRLYAMTNKGERLEVKFGVYLNELTESSPP